MPIDDRVSQITELQQIQLYDESSQEICSTNALKYQHVAIRFLPYDI